MHIYFAHREDLLQRFQSVVNLVFIISSNTKSKNILHYLLVGILKILFSFWEDTESNHEGFYYLTFCPIFIDYILPKIINF